MTNTTTPPTSPDCGPRFRLSIGDGPFRRWFCLNAEHGCGYTDREEEAQWFSASEVMAAVGCLHDVSGDHAVLLTPEPAPQPEHPAAPTWRKIMLYDTVPAQQPEQPAKPTPVAPTEPGLYPLADGTTVYLVGPDYAGDWVGMHGKYARCWRYDGSGRGVPAVIGPRIPEPVDPAAAFACVNELAAAGELEVRARSSMTDPDKYTDWSFLGTGYQFRHTPKRPTITPPPADWPPEMREAAIDAATKRGLEVAE